jgi:Ca-activated chloride channel family protein
MAPQAFSRGYGSFVFALLCACGSGPEGVALTAATVEPVRRSVTLDEQRVDVLERVGIGQSIITDASGFAKLTLDAGPRLLLGRDASVKLVDTAAIELGRGPVFVEVEGSDRIDLESGHASFTLGDAGASFTVSDAALVVYVLRGEVSYRTADARGVVRAGEELTLGAGVPAIAPAVLWNDWTGGYARPGPGDESGARGFGVLEARVPDEIGRARWPLVVRRLDVNVRIVGDLAITEVDEVFFNPASETVEGLYRVEVPESAVLQRFAVDRNGRLVDGYVREKAQAQQAYEAQVYRGSTDDPALLEWDAPGSYRARIYPIGAGETRRIVIRYAEWLGRARSDGPRLYRYPMGGGVGVPQIQEFSLVADVTQAGEATVRAGFGAEVESGVVQLRRSDFLPHSDFWLELDDASAPEGLHAARADHVPPPRDPTSRAIPNEADERDYYYVPIVLPASVLPEGRGAGPIDLVIVADVSAATDRPHLELGRAMVEALAAQLRPEDRVAIVTSDLTIRPVGEGTAELTAATLDALSPLLEGLARAPAGGGTDLAATLTAAAGLLDPARGGAVVYVGDGAPTVGELGSEGLLASLERLPNPTRFYAIGIGSEANLDLLETITRGGGLAMRVDERTDAARAAMRIVSHAERPLAHRVTVELGAGIDNVFPRRPVDVVIGDVLPVSGRIADEPPAQIVVKGEVYGEPFEIELPVTTIESEDAIDLRLRWAGERLRELLLDGASREEIAELGTRYGLITPFTSYYVPSARELSSMPGASRFIDQPMLRLAVRDREPAPSMLGARFVPLALAGCFGRDAPGAAPDESDGEDDEGAAEVQTRSEVASVEQAQSPLDPAPAPPVVTTTPTLPAGQASQEPSRDFDGSGGDIAELLDHALAREAPAEEAAEPEATAGAGGTAGFYDGEHAPARRPANAETVRTELEADERRSRGREDSGVDQSQYEGVIRTHAGEVQRCYEAARASNPSLAGVVTLALTISEIGAVRDATVIRSTLGDASVERCIVSASYRWAFPAPPSGTVRVVYPFTFGSIRGQKKVGHEPSLCSDAASLTLVDRRVLWRERLGNAPLASDWIDVYHRALQDCEARTWRDRRALLSLMLGRAGSMARMIELYELVDDGAARTFMRAAILARVRTPEELRLVRQSFGLSASIDWELVNRVVERQPNAGARIRTLRKFLTDFPSSFDLKLRLLEELERAGRIEEARRFAHRLREDPSADPGVRTAVGEFFLRLGNEDEARRVFSEIVEFAPLDELARRRLGDLYRAHGWFEDAYRQYLTLSEIRPDDPTVFLLLAQAAAGTGRVDEALRLEQRLTETAQPGQASGVARTAILWSSVRFAKLRKEAADQEARDALIGRMRRSGVLREAGALRVSLTWSHPDAQLTLWGAYPGLGLSRPMDIAPEYGIEVFDVREAEPGTYRIEVRRNDPGGTREHTTAIDAELVVLWNEGQADEKIEIIPVRFEGSQLTHGFTITGREIARVEGERR